MARSTLVPWQTLNRDSLLEAPPWLRVWRETVRLPEGQVVEDYHIVEIPDFAVVVPFTRRGRLVVERHYRHGVRRVVLGLPAGQGESGENPEAAARRELLEETGYGGGLWRSLGVYTISDSRIRGNAHLFAARGVERVVEATSDDLERTEVLLMTQRRFLTAMAEGDVPDLAAVAAFLLARGR